MQIYYRYAIVLYPELPSVPQEPRGFSGNVESRDLHGTRVHYMSCGYFAYP